MTSLTDALAHWQTLRDAGRLDPFIDPLAEAARRVAQAPEVWWCETHDGFGGKEKPWSWWPGAQLCLAVRPAEDNRPCRMVRKLLVDPADKP